jgi:hypothetical protein
VQAGKGEIKGGETMKEIIAKGKLVLGKIDYNKSGRKNCQAIIKWKLESSENGPVFSASADIWNPKHTDIYAGGQMVDEVASYFPHNKKAQRILEIWKAYHLNDLNAGTPEQTAAIREWEARGNKYDYTQAYEYLKSIGLYDITLAEDTPAFGGTLPKGSQYKYGARWIYRNIPEEIVNEIKSWVKEAN